MHVVITGSTRGIGLALARQFLAAGDNVLISSRSQDRVDSVTQELNKLFSGHVEGMVADVTKYESVEALAKFAQTKWRSIDIWINNAGAKGGKGYLQNREPEQIAMVMQTNITGTLFGCRAAINAGVRHIFNVDGMGSDGKILVGSIIYGTSKRPIPYISKALAKELEAQDLKISIHTISPGMVLTDLLLSHAELKQKRVFNILAEQPSTVMAYLVPKMRSVAMTTKTGKYFKYLTNFRATLRFLTAWRYKNRFFDEEGNLLVELEG